MTASKGKTVLELIEKLGGELLHGDPKTVLTSVSDTRGAKAYDLVFAEDAASAEGAIRSQAGAVVLPSELKGISFGSGIAVGASQPRLWFARAAKMLAKPLPVTGVHEAAEVAQDAVLGEDVSVGPCAVIGHLVQIGARSRVDAGAVLGDGVQVGEDCHIYPRAVLYSGTSLGDRVVIHAGAVLGADGFGYVRDRTSGSYTQFPQQGSLILEDDVEIGANTTIDRGALTETRIRRGVKLDNLIHIGHNCDIGENVVMASLTGISGSSTVGKGAILAGQVGVGDHAHIGEGVILGGQAGVLSGKTVNTKGTVLWGTPAKPIREYLRELATLSRLSRRKKE